MATLAVRAHRVSAFARLGLGPVLVLGLASLGLSRIGALWDVSWHRVIGRDTFWSPPHLFIYGGVTIMGLAALYATLTAMAGRPTHGRELRLGPLRAELGLALVGLGALGIIASAPFDDLWHRLFGRDVDVWSPPHLTAIAFGALANIGWAAGLAPGVFPIGDGLRRAFRALFLGNLLGAFVFATNFYAINAATRDAFFYPVLIALLAPFALAIADALLGGRWAATQAALWFTGLALATYAALDASGWRAPAFPPLILAGALAADALRARGGRGAHPFAIGVAFAASFVAAELARALLFPPATSLSAGAVGELRSAIVGQYYSAALARPWLSLWPVAAVVVGSVLAALSWSAGSWIGRMLAQSRADGQGDQASTRA